MEHITYETMWNVVMGLAKGYTIRTVMSRNKVSRKYVMDIRHDFAVGRGGGGEQRELMAACHRVITRGILESR